MVNKHTAYDLAQMQSLSLESKIRMTQRRIRDWYEHWDGQVYVSFSGGKDSTVLKHIVDEMYDDVPALFVNTGLEYPEIQKFVNDVKKGRYECFSNNVEIVRPEMRFNEVVKEYGYPVVSKEVARAVHYARKGDTKSGEYYMKKFNGTLMYKEKKSPYNHEKWKFLLDSDFDISSFCCDVMKKKPAKQYYKQTGRKPLIATMASESRLRYQKWIQNGCNSFEGKSPSSQPLSFWTEQDILQYIKKYNVPYCSVYGDIIPVSDEDQQLEGQMDIFESMAELFGCPPEELPGYQPISCEQELKTTGCNRTGCVFCMFGCHLEKEPNRFQRLKETHPRQYEYCINGGEMVDGKWQPNKEGLGLGKVLDYIGVDYK